MSTGLSPSEQRGTLTLAQLIDLRRKAAAEVAGLDVEIYMRQVKPSALSMEAA